MTFEDLRNIGLPYGSARRLKDAVAAESVVSDDTLLYADERDSYHKSTDNGKDSDSQTTSSDDIDYVHTSDEDL